MRSLFWIIALSMLTTVGLVFFLRWAMAQQGFELGWHGSVAMTLGLFFTMLLGSGLMALLFHSNRSGHDDIAAGQAQDTNDDDF